MPSAIFKVIIEAPQLTEQEICQAVDLCVEGRADYVKTSTGWYPGCPSTVEQVRIMSREAAGRIQIKAAGGIRSLETIQEMQKAGCSRFGMGMRSVQNLIKVSISNLLCKSYKKSRNILRYSVTFLLN